MVRLLTFVHRSPYATWNSLQALIRQEQAVPEEVVVLHLGAVAEHAELVREGIERLMRHYGGEPAVRLMPVAENRFPVWMDALGTALASGGRWMVDITPARTVPKIAAMQALRRHKDTVAVYLDVEGYRYDPKPFSWVPYNIQTMRTLTPEKKEIEYRTVQFFGPFPGVPAMKHLPAAGQRVGADDAREVLVPWEALVVLLNEAGAAAHGKKGVEGVSRFEIKVPHLGVTVGTYDMERRRLRLEPEDATLRQLADGLGFLTGAWAHDVPGYSDVLEALVVSGLLPFRNQHELRNVVHQAAVSTTGPGHDRPLRWIGMDTNLFHLEFLTTIAAERRVPLSRIPVVVSHVVEDEIRNQMRATLPRGDPPRQVQEGEVHRPHRARLAHVAHQEFELLRTRCRMEVHRHRDPGTSSDHNDQAIVDDMVHYANQRKETVYYLTNDAGCHDRATAAGGRLEPIHVRFGDPATELDETPALDKVAAFIYRLSLAFGRVSLKGLGVDVFGDHPNDQREAYLHEKVRIRVPDREWTRGFVHELGLRERLDEVMRERGVWL